MDDRTQLDQIKLEVDVRLEEYRALRAEIVLTLGAAQSTSSLAITASGFLLAGSPFIIQYRAPYLFLVASYGFCLIAWTQLRYAQAVFNLSEHIADRVAPGIRRAVAAVSDGRQEAFWDLLSWERAGRKSTHADPNWSLPIESARYMLPLLAAFVSAIAYLINGVSWLRDQSWQRILFWVSFASSILLCLYTASLTARLRHRLRGDADARGGHVARK